MAMKYNFDVPVDQSLFNGMKWEQRYRNEKDLLCFSLADSDFEAPPQLTDRIAKRARVPHYGYAYRPDSFYESVVNWYMRHTGWIVEPEWISKGYGIYPSVCLIIQEFTEPDEGVIFQTPVHEVFWTVVEANGRNPVENPLVLEGDKYQFDYEDFERKIIEQNVTMFLLCSPHNPVCRLWSEDELKRLADICIRHGVLIVSDEVYAPLAHPGFQFKPIASLSEDISMQTITCFSPSKAFSLTGIKDSLTIIENSEYMNRYEKALIRMNMNFGANLFGNVAIQCVLDECDDWLEQHIDYVIKNRDTMVEYFRDNLPLLKLMPSEATCFAWIDCRALGFEDSELDEFLQNEAGVLLRPGYHMGPGGYGFMRMMLSCPRTIMLEGLDRIKIALENR